MSFIAPRFGVVYSSRFESCSKGLLMRFFVFSLVILFGFCVSLPAQADWIEAGVGKIDITPPLKLNAPLGGYGERMSKPARGVHDRIFAKALSVSNGSRRFVVVTADMIGFPPTFKPEIIQELGDPNLTLENLLLLPSHSHTSVEMNAFHPGNTYNIPQIGIYNQEVHKFLIQQFTTVIQMARKNPVPVRIGTSNHLIPGWNRNRRHQGGYTDDELTLTRVDTLDGKSLAVLANFTAHPTFLGPEQMEFSGDWPGQFQRTLESLVGQETTVMYYNGAEGDQAPVARPDSGASPWERQQSFGTDLAIVAWRAFLMTETQRDLVFDFHRQEITLPSTGWHPNFMETGGAEYGLTEEILKEMLLTMFPKTTASVTLRLGDLLIVGIPGELSAELGRTIKQRAFAETSAAFPVIGGLADEWDSYILSASEYRLGGYEASVSFYGENLGQTIVEGALKGVSHVFRR